MAKAIKLLEQPNINAVLSNIDEAPPEMIQHFFGADTLYLDTETTGLVPWKTAEIALVQLYDKNSGDVLLGRVQENQAPPEWLRTLFTKGKKFVGHNIANFDLHFMHCWGLPWKESTYYDTLIGESLLAVSGRNDVSKSLRASVKRRTGHIVEKDIEHGGWRNEELTQKQIDYAAIDVLVLPGLMEEHLTMALDTGAMPALEMEMEVLPVFAQISINGLPVDTANLDTYMELQAEKASKAKVLLLERLGNINFNSPIKVRRALNSIGIELTSTAKNILADQIAFDPEAENNLLLQAILDYRAPSKRTSMYGSPEWQEEHIQPDGRIHSRFWQCGAETTRVASDDPNLQQVPKDGRQIIGGVPGFVIVSVDYSQIEIRIAADISIDTTLIKLLDHEDVHTAIASQIYQTPVHLVTPKQRKLAKACVFTLLFGGGAKRLYNYAKTSGSHITFQEAEDVFERFFSLFQGLFQMRQKAYYLARNRRVTTITLPNGARRVLAGKSNRPSVILNTPVQGSAAVGLKYGLIEAGKQGLDTYLGAVVHDETVSCVPSREAKDFTEAMSKCMITGMERVVTNCPIKVEAKVGTHWQA